ncbi:MAG: LysR family transcriptional regulator [Candidatus Binataceae bacterium]
MRGLNLDQLRTFAGVVEHKSFSAAAERLGISQPAVSLQVRQLERRFGVKLIERVGRNAAPTAAGLEFLTHARNIEAAVGAATEAMAPHASGAAGRVRLGTGATACIYLLPPILRDLRQRLPSLDIVVSTGNSPDILRAIEENRIDVGLVTLPAPGRMFDVRPVLEDEFVVIISREGARLPRDVTAAELAKLPLVLYEPGANTRRIVDEWALRAGVSLKPIMELGSVEAMKELIGAGLGCGILPRMALRRKEEADPFVVRSLKPRLYRKLGLVLRRDKPLTKGLRELVRAVMTLK